MTGEETSLRQIIASIANGARQESAVIMGKVISSKPLKISLVNDSKVILTSNDLVLSERFRTHTVTVDIAGVKSSAKMTVHSGISSGDKVYLISYNNGNKFFVLDRV